MPASRVSCQTQWQLQVGTECWSTCPCCELGCCCCCCCCYEELRAPGLGGGVCVWGLSAEVVKGAGWWTGWPAFPDEAKSAKGWALLLQNNLTMLQMSNA